METLGFGLGPLHPESGGGTKKSLLMMFKTKVAFSINSSHSVSIKEPLDFQLIIKPSAWQPYCP